MEQSTWIRDTLIRKEVYDLLPASNKQQIDALIDKYNKIHYIDARTEIGPSQSGRMTKKQKEQMTNSQLQVFSIEIEIQELIKPEAQIRDEKQQKETEIRIAEIDSIKNQIKTLECYCAHKLSSKRNNATRRAFHDLKQRLLLLES